jgi:hypothetical protein
MLLVCGVVMPAPPPMPVLAGGLLAQAARRETAASAAMVVIFIRKASLSWVHGRCRTLQRSNRTNVAVARAI